MGIFYSYLMHHNYMMNVIDCTSRHPACTVDVFGVLTCWSWVPGALRRGPPGRAGTRRGRNLWRLEALRSRRGSSRTGTCCRSCTCWRREDLRKEMLLSPCSRSVCFRVCVFAGVFFGSEGAYLVHIWSSALFLQVDIRPGQPKLWFDVKR